MAFIPKSKRKRYNPKPKKRFGDDPFYNSGTWRKISKDIRKLFLLCPVCEETGPEMVDHVIPRRHGGASYDFRNLLPMCHACHNRKRALERKGPLLPTKESNKCEGLVPKGNKMDVVEKLKK